MPSAGRAPYSPFRVGRRVTRGRVGMANRERRARSQMPAGYAVAELEAALAVPADPGAAGFFDVDNTVMQGGAVHYPARRLGPRQDFTPPALLRGRVPHVGLPGPPPGD